jgi:hypothetical protein
VSALDEPALPDFLAKVAAELGAPWSAHRTTSFRSWAFELCGPDRARLRAGIDGGRLIFNGALPEGVESATNLTTMHMTVALTKTAEQVAREVRRRLLGPYLAELPAALARQARRNEQNAARDAVKTQCREALAALGAVYESQRGELGAGDRSGLGNVQVGEISYAHNGTYPVDAKLRVPTTRLVDVVRAVVAELDPAQPDRAALLAELAKLRTELAGHRAVKREAS